MIISYFFLDNIITLNYHRSGIMKRAISMVAQDHPKNLRGRCSLLNRDRPFGTNAEMRPLDNSGSGDPKEEDA
jgi:hypothetical protein